MVLALVLATLNDLPELPESIFEPLQAYTPLSYRYFPGREVSYQVPNQKHYRRSVKFPSLVELCLHRIRTHNCGSFASHEDELSRRHLLSPMLKNVPFYIKQKEQCISPNIYSSRREPTPQFRMMYLSAATLIVVPDNLVTQWSSEIMKHCRISLRVLILHSATKIPGANKLASEYDVSLPSHMRMISSLSVHFFRSF